MLARIINIAHKDFLHLWHNRLLLILVIFGGAAELTLVGLATGADIDDVRMAVVDQDDTELSRELIQDLANSDTLRLDEDASAEFQEYSRQERDQALDAIFTGGFFGTQPVILVEIPEGFGEELIANQQPTIALTFNGANSLTSTVSRRAAEDIITRFGFTAIEQKLAQANGVPIPSDAQIANQLMQAQPSITVKYNEELRRADYTTPSETAFVLGIITLMIAAIMLAREREYGTFEQLLVMPLRPIEIIFGKSIPAIVMGLTNFILLLGLMRFGFKIPFRGSLALLLVLATGYLFVELGRGFMVAMISRTQNQALLLVMLIAFVDITFSGYAVPVESMPQVMQALSNFFPIRHWMIVLRGVMQKDVGLGVLWPQLVWLVILGIIINSVTLWFFRRSLGEQR